MLANKLYNKNIYAQDSTVGISLAIVLSIVIIVFPFVGFCLSLMFFRQKNCSLAIYCFCVLFRVVL